MLWGIDMRERLIRVKKERYIGSPYVSIQTLYKSGEMRYYGLYLGKELREMINKRGYKFADIYVSNDLKYMEIHLLKEKRDEHSFALIESSKGKKIACEALATKLLSKGIKRPKKVEVKRNKIMVYWR